MARYTDDECRESLRLAASSLDADVLLVRQYEAWRSGHPGFPNSALIGWRFGCWAAALTAAGLESRGRPRRQPPSAPEVDTGPAPFSTAMAACPSCDGEVVRLPGTRVEGTDVVQPGRCRTCGALVQERVRFD